MDYNQLLTIVLQHCYSDPVPGDVAPIAFLCTITHAKGCHVLITRETKNLQHTVHYMYSNRVYVVYIKVIFFDLLIKKRLNLIEQAIKNC